MLCLTSPFSSSFFAMLPAATPVLWVLGVSRCPVPWATLHSPTSCAKKRRMGVPVGQEPTRASVGVRKTKERGISRKSLLPQNQCSYLPPSHDLLGHPSCSQCKHGPENCQGRSCDEASFSMNTDLPESLEAGERKHQTWFLNEAEINLGWFASV